MQLVMIMTDFNDCFREQTYAVETFTSIALFTHCSVTGGLHNYYIAVCLLYDVLLYSYVFTVWRSC